MISNEDVKQALKSQKAIKVIPTDAKRVVIVLPKGIVGKNVEYVDWNGKKCKGEGFLFFNSTDKRVQFLKANGGIIIGYEGECIEDGKTVLRSKAVQNYLKNNPNAFEGEENIKKTFDYFLSNIFRHGDDVRVWDEKGIADMWSSDTDWLVDNFNNEDIFDEDGELKRVISGIKKTNVYDAVYFGPNFEIEGIGTTSIDGSWAIAQNKKFNLVADNVFKSVYKRISNKIQNIMSSKQRDN